jgi:hypothetical protein
MLIDFKLKLILDLNGFEAAKIWQLFITTRRYFFQVATAASVSECFIKSLKYHHFRRFWQILPSLPARAKHRLRRLYPPPPSQKAKAHHDPELAAPPPINYFDIQHFADNMKKLNEYSRFHRDAFKEPDDKENPI